MGSHFSSNVVRATRHVTGWIQPGDTLLKEFGELRGAPHCRPSGALATVSQLCREASFLPAAQGGT